MEVRVRIVRGLGVQPPDIFLTLPVHLCNCILGVGMNPSVAAMPVG